jgi:hypothetical protein
MKTTLISIPLAWLVAGVGTVLTSRAQLIGPPLPSEPAAKSSAAGTPKIQFADTTYDFGKAKPTDAVKHDFVFTNVGNALLEITDVRPGCGCTTAGEWTKQVEPGKTGKIPIQFNPSSFTGPVGKSVTLSCNDPTQPAVLLQIRGSVWRPIEVNPNFAYFYPTEGTETNETKVVRIVNNLEDPLQLSEPEWTNPAFKAELKTIRPGKEFEVRVTLVPPLNASTVQCPIALKTSSSNMPLISITAFAMIQPLISAMPAQLWLPAGPLPTNNQYSISIRNNSTNAVKLAEPSVNVEGATVKMQETQAGRYFTLQIGFPAGYQVKAGQTAEFSVKTDHPKYPVIKVPVMQFPAPAQVARPTAATPLKAAGGTVH